MKKAFSERLLFSLLIFIFAFALTSCDENLLVRAQPTPEGRRVVDSVYESIVGVEKKVFIKKISFLDFVTNSTLGKESPDKSPEGEAKWESDRAAFKEIVLWAFGEKANDFLPEVSLTLLEGFNIGDFDRLASLHTKADIAYMNERLGSICEEGKAYTEVLTGYYGFLSNMMEGGRMDGVISLEDNAQVELKIADAVTVRLATRFLFNTLVEAVWSDWAESGMAVDEYIKNLSTETVVYILTKKNMFEDILNTYTILNKLKGSTTIVDIGFLEESAE